MSNYTLVFLRLRLLAGRPLHVSLEVEVEEEHEEEEDLASPDVSKHYRQVAPHRYQRRQIDDANDKLALEQVNHVFEMDVIK